MMAYVFARYKPGIVNRESLRISHVLEVPEDGEFPETLKTLCGQQFTAGVLEQLKTWEGMPCLGCTLNMPIGRELEG